MAMIHCRECGTKISDTASSCPKCGAKNSSSENSPTSAFRLDIPLSKKWFEKQPQFLQKLFNQHPAYKWIYGILSVIGAFILVYVLFKFFGLW